MIAVYRTFIYLFTYWYNCFLAIGQMWCRFLSFPVTVNANYGYEKSHCPVEPPHSSLRYAIHPFYVILILHGPCTRSNCVYVRCRLLALLSQCKWRGSQLAPASRRSFASRRQASIWIASQRVTIFFYITNYKCVVLLSIVLSICDENYSVVLTSDSCFWVLWFFDMFWW